MIRTVKARYSRGMLQPLEPLALEEGEEVTVSIEGEPPVERAGESLLEMFDRLHDSFPTDASDDLPTDFAMNYKHYLYGWPKEEDE